MKTLRPTTLAALAWSLEGFARTHYSADRDTRGSVELIATVARMTADGELTETALTVDDLLYAVAVMKVQEASFDSMPHSDRSYNSAMILHRAASVILHSIALDEERDAQKVKLLS